MQDVIGFLREEAEKCQQIAKIAEPEMVKSWLRSAELFERAANFIEARQESWTDEMEPTGGRNGTGKWYHGRRKCHREMSPRGVRFGRGTRARMLRNVKV